MKDNISDDCNKLLFGGCSFDSKIVGDQITSLSSLIANPSIVLATTTLNIVKDGNILNLSFKAIKNLVESNTVPDPLQSDMEKVVSDLIDDFQLEPNNLRLIINSVIIVLEPMIEDERPIFNAIGKARHTNAILRHNQGILGTKMLNFLYLFLI